MNSSLIAEAISVAQEYDLRVFPVSDSKRPVVKGWRSKATSDPAEIEALFSAPGAAGIGVPCGPDNDLICFDLDFGHTDDPDRKAKLSAWLQQHATPVSDGAILRETRSGGLHVIMLWPQGCKVPRRIMPKFDVIIEGFYFVWSMQAGGYKMLQEAELDEPTEAMLQIVERDQFGDGSALMTAEAAHDAMWSDGDSGIRHDALLRMTQDWAAEHPGATITTWCSEFEQWFRDIYGDRLEAERLENLMEWDVREERGELYRAFAGVSTTPEHANDLLAQAMQKKGKPDSVHVPQPSSTQTRETKQEVAERIVSEFEDIDLNVLRTTEMPDIDWIVDDLIPAGNLISITGPSGAGKTRFNSLLLAALSTGNTDKIGLPKADRPIRSLYIANEERTEDVKRRLKAAAMLNDLRGDMLVTVRGKEHGRFSLCHDGQVLDEVVSALISLINERDIELVALDPVVTLGIDDENAAAQVDVAMQALQNIAAATGACVMFVHHSPKGERGAPEDLLRGDSGAWRGSGVFYSSLDLGLTLMPWLPSECHDKQGGKENRRKWRYMVRNHQAPKYVVLDSAKERENEGLGSVMYEITGQEVRVGGRRIGAMRPVSAEEAQLQATMLLSQAEGVDQAAAQSWARTILDHPDWREEGSHTITLRQLAEWFDKKAPIGWDTNRNKDEKLRTDRGLGKRLLDTLENSHNIAGTWVYLVHDGKHVVCQVSGVS